MLLCLLANSCIFVPKAPMKFYLESNRTNFPSFFSGSSTQGRLNPLSQDVSLTTFIKH